MNRCGKHGVLGFSLEWDYTLECVGIFICGFCHAEFFSPSLRILAILPSFHVPSLTSPKPCHSQLFHMIHHMHHVKHSWLVSELKSTVTSLRGVIVPVISTVTETGCLKDSLRMQHLLLLIHLSLVAQACSRKGMAETVCLPGDHRVNGIH